MCSSVSVGNMLLCVCLERSHGRAMGLSLTCISTPHTCCHARGSCCQLPAQSSCRTQAQWHQTHLQTPPDQQNHLLRTCGEWTPPAQQSTCHSHAALKSMVWLTRVEPLEATQVIMQSTSCMQSTSMGWLLITSRCERWCQPSQISEHALQ